MKYHRDQIYVSCKASIPFAAHAERLCSLTSIFLPPTFCRYISTGIITASWNSCPLSLPIVSLIIWPQTMLVLAVDLPVKGGELARRVHAVCGPLHQIQQRQLDFYPVGAYIGLLDYNVLKAQQHVIYL